MRIAFIIDVPHLRADVATRQPDRQAPAAPQIAGALVANGYHDIRQYDFEVQILRLEWESPGRLNLRAFFDDAPSTAFYRG
jgi:hypothetical protein